MISAAVFQSVNIRLVKILKLLILPVFVEGFFVIIGNKPQVDIAVSVNKLGDLVFVKILLGFGIPFYSGVCPDFYARLFVLYRIGRKLFNPHIFLAVILNFRIIC